MWNWLGITNENKLTKSDEVNKEEVKTDDGGENKNSTEIEEPKTNNEVNKLNDKSADIATTPTDIAVNVGNYLYNFANVATKAASKLKEKVDDKLEKTIVGDFKRENETFIQQNEARRIDDATPPWVGYHEESTMKRQILALPVDERNFLRDPPSGVEFHFVMSHIMPVAMAALKEDKALQEMRFKLVPKRIKEENFWRNYFYRVTLIKQSSQLSTMADAEIERSTRSASSSSECLDIKAADTSNGTESVLEDHEVEAAGSPVANEFVSDTFLTEDAGLSEEEKNAMLGGTENLPDDPTETSKTTVHEDWEIEKELQEELESFELVNETSPSNDDGGDWEKEIEDMLELEDTNENN